MTKDAVFEEENMFLSHVLSNIDYKIEQMQIKREFSRQEAEDIGIPDLEDKGTKAKYIREYFEYGPKIEALKELKQVPHFGRMDLKLVEDDKVESLNMYIGEKGITDKDLKTLVYDWRSPVANLYYMANQTTFKYNDTEYELKLKRQIDIEDSKLISCQTTYEDGKTINVTDNFLLKVLEQKKNRNEFADIIRTIQANQNNIIRESINNNAIVQGVAGSGKTVVLLHRISYLTYNHPEIDSKRIIFITPSKIFKTKLEKINRSLALTDILMITIKEYYLSKIKKYIPSLKIKDVVDDNELEPLKELYSEDMLHKIDNIIKEELKELDDLLKSIGQKIDYENIFKSLNFIHEKIKTSLKLETWNTFEERDLLEKIKSKITPFIKKDILKRFIDIIYNNIKEEHNLKRKSWINNKEISKVYAYLLIYIYHKYGFYIDNEYKYIFLDEMQDYANNEIKTIINIEKNPNINLYGDINQNIIPYIPKKTIDELKELIKNNRTNNEVVYYELLQNYRNTREITDYCNVFLETKMQPMGINSDPVLEITTNDIVSDIKNKFSTEYIVLTNDKKITKELNNYEVLSIKEAKGLEFSKVIVIDQNLNPIERYVGFTRTLDKLVVYK